MQIDSLDSLFGLNTQARFISTFNNSHLPRWGFELWDIFPTFYFDFRLLPYTTWLRFTRLRLDGRILDFGEKVWL
jgi:hypothetical protein